MSDQTKVLVFAGSQRKASLNKMLAAAGAKALEAQNIKATIIDLADYPAPVFNGDDEDQNGLPETMVKLKDMFASHDAVMIATPEFNGSYHPILSNILNWTSRANGDDANCMAFAGKPAAIMAASPGPLGGVRVIPRLRDFLAELGFVAVPGFVTVPNAYEAFDDNGSLSNEETMNSISGLANRLAQAC